MNIEEIEKEILTLNIHECDIEDIFEILDKYNNQPDYKTISQIAKMISSGEIPKEVYDKYLGDCPIGFMNYGDLLKYLTNNQSDYKSAFDEIFEKSHYKNITMEDMIDFSKKYNLGSGE